MSVAAPGPHPALHSWGVPEHPLISPLPYYPGLAEYAGLVRREVLRRQDRSFAIAVDLPQGLERTVLDAVKRLPSPSLIIDRLSRGIPVLPSSAPIEAVRSYLEFGFDLRFIDASLPVTGSMGDYQAFISACRRFGLERVLRDPRGYGVHPDELFHSRLAPAQLQASQPHFPHSPDVFLRRGSVPYDEATASPYLHTRLAYMAQKVRELEETGIEVLLVCDARSMNGILHHLDRAPEPIDDTFVVPTRTVPLREVDVCRVTEEVPFCAYLSEVYRGLPVDRRAWLQHLVREASDGEEGCSRLLDAGAFAEKVALMHADSSPDLPQLLVAATTVCGDGYALNLLNLALSYPPAKEPPRLGTSHARWPVLNELVSCSIQAGYLERSIEVLDSYFIPVQGYHLKARPWRMVLKGRRRDSRLEDRLINGDRRPRIYNRWRRTPASYRAEREFTQYVLSRFPPGSTSDRDWHPVEYHTSLELGVDLRECLRNRHLDRVYVRSPDAGGDACYVFDYRGYVSRGSAGAPRQKTVMPAEDGCLSPFFFDRYLEWAGLGVENRMHYDSAILAMFTTLAAPVTGFFSTLDRGNPLSSAVSLGLRHGGRVIVFTDRPEELESSVMKSGRVTRRPLGAIPIPVLDRMAAFDIHSYRHEDTRGD